MEWITKSSYDASQKAVVFETGHFSVYGIGYKNPAPAFTDITGHWAADNILFAASRGLLSGISDTTFSPVSYTHLDVYKRQELRYAVIARKKKKPLC